MQKIGKILIYDMGVGKIITSDGEYLFTFKDLENYDDCKKDDLVTFRAEEVLDTKRAFFVKKLVLKK